MFHDNVRNAARCWAYCNVDGSAIAVLSLLGIAEKGNNGNDLDMIE
jgi:hypothetical protein